MTRRLATCYTPEMHEAFLKVNTQYTEEDRDDGKVDVYVEQLPPTDFDPHRFESMEDYLQWLKRRGALNVAGPLKHGVYRRTGPGTNEVTWL